MFKSKLYENTILFSTLLHLLLPMMYEGIRPITHHYTTTVIRPEINPIKLCNLISEVLFSPYLLPGTLALVINESFVPEVKSGKSTSFFYKRQKQPIVIT